MYKIKLHDFEGPLDLLLFFVKRDELDIYDIPIAHITKEFLEYIQIMRMMDLEVAGEFIVMASMLMQIKAKMLLPSVDEEEEEEEDPRAELVRRLIDYKRFKEMASVLEQYEKSQKQFHYRKNFRYDAVDKNDDENEVLLKNVTLYDLISAFKRAVDTMPKIRHHAIEKVPVSVEEQIDLITLKIKENGKIGFRSLVSQMKRIEIVVTFIAILEMVRMNLVSLEQNVPYEDFVIRKAS